MCNFLTKNSTPEFSSFFQTLESSYISYVKVFKFLLKRGHSQKKCPLSEKFTLVGCLLQKAAANHQFQPTGTCSKSSKETPEKLVNSVQVTIMTRERC